MKARVTVTAQQLQRKAKKVKAMNIPMAPLTNFRNEVRQKFPSS
jgi:hypothetical protein